MQSNRSFDILGYISRENHALISHVNYGCPIFVIPKAALAICRVESNLCNYLQTYTNKK